MHTQCMKPPDVYAQHSVLIVPTMLMSLAGNGVLANGNNLMFQQVKQEDSPHAGRNKSSKGTHPIEGITSQARGLTP